MNLILTVGLMLGAIAFPFALSGIDSSFVGSVVHPAMQKDDAGQVRDQITKSVPLARGSRVTVRGLNGSLTIETWEGETAEIDIAITASDAEALARRPLVISDTGNGLTIGTEDKDRRGEWGRDKGWVRHRARLRLPRSVNLEVNGINGRVQVGEISGSIGLSGINGAVDVAEAASATRLNGINGHVSIALSKLGSEGLDINGINGGVELSFIGTVNAAIDVHGINGGVSSDFPMTVIGEMKRGEMRGTIGSGGPSIVVKGINGGVQLKRR